MTNKPIEGKTVEAPENGVKKPASTESKAKVKKQYRLKSLMNVRKAPSLDAPILAVEPREAVVQATLEGDWLHLAEGYIFFEGGKWAEKI